MAAPVFVSNEVVTATKMNSLPKGILGYAQVTAAQTGISADTDLTGLSVAVNCEASRRIRITAQVPVNASTVDNAVSVRIKESTTLLQQLNATAARSGASETIYGAAIITPTAGSHTFKLTLIMAAGTGTVGNNATANQPAFILVEDIGGV